MHHPLNSSMYSTATERVLHIRSTGLNFKCNSLSWKTNKNIASPQQQITETNFKYMNVKLKLMRTMKSYIRGEGRRLKQHYATTVK